MEERKDSLSEEAAAFGQRVKGAAKDTAGAATGNTSLEREGERENTIGRERQAANDAVVAATPTSSSSSWDRTGYVTGLYRTPDEAGRAYDHLTTKHGYKPDDVAVLMSEDTRRTHFGDAKPGEEYATGTTTTEGGTKAAEGFGKGSAIGGGIGAALAAIFAIGSNVVIPGLGLVVAGPIAAALAGAGAGGATGGIIGALIGAGIPEERAREYDRGLREGGVVLGTRARDDAHAAELERDYNTFGGTSILR